MSEWDSLHAYFTANGCVELTVRSREPFDVKKHFDDWLKKCDRERDVLIGELIQCWRNCWALGDDPDHSYAIAAQAHQECADELESLRPDASRLLDRRELAGRLREAERGREETHEFLFRNGWREPEELCFWCHRAGNLRKQLAAIDAELKSDSRPPTGGRDGTTAE